MRLRENSRCRGEVSVLRERQDNAIVSGNSLNRILSVEGLCAARRDGLFIFVFVYERHGKRV
jgi:hypothetical protein